MHDKKIYDENLGEKVNEWEFGLGDKGYQGADRVLSPWKGKKDTLEKQKRIFNYIVNANRAKVENAFSRLKLFDIMKGPFRAKNRGKVHKVAKVCASLVNIDLECRPLRKDANHIYLPDWE